MRLRELWREAARNVGTGASHGVISMVAFLAISLCLGGVATRGVVDVSTGAVAFRDAGASVFRLDAPGDIDGRACDALARVDGVDASGATRAGDPLRFALLPDLPTPYFDATPGLTRLLGIQPEAPTAGLIIDAEIADSLGINDLPDETFVTNADAPTSIAATFSHPDDGRDSTLSGVALGLALDDGDAFDSCWVRFWPPTQNPLELLGTVLKSSGGTGDASQWNPTLGRTLDPQADFNSLPTTGLTAAAALIAAALAFGAVRMRRLELASARHIGITRANLIGMTSAELFIWWTPACALALTTLAFAAVWQNPDAPMAAWLAGARIIGAASAAWFLTTALTAGAIRENHLVRYFQQR